MTATATRPEAARPPAGESPRRDAELAQRDVRRTLLALVAAMLGVFPLCELFVDRGWLIDVWLSMVVVIAPAAVLRRHRPPSAGQIWIGVIALIPWLTVNFVRQHALFALVPLGGTWHDVGALMTDLHHTTSSEVAPVHSTVAVRLALSALLGLVAALVDLLAVVGRRGALAGVPLLIIYTVSGAVPRHPVSWVWFALSAAGFLTLLAIDSSDDLHRWGHFIPRTRKGGRGQVGSFPGGRIAAAAIAIAVILPLLIPSNSRNFVANLFHPQHGGAQDGFGADQNGNGSGASGIDPFAKLRGQLIRPQEINLLSVTVSSSTGVGTPNKVQPFYLRTNVLPTFTGDGWRPGKPGTPEPLDQTQFESSPGTRFADPSVDFTAQIKSVGLHSNPPVFVSPTGVSGVGDGTEWDPQDMLLVGSTISKGDTITEQVSQPNPTVAELRAATRSNPAMARWTALPPIAAFVKTTTAKIVAGAATPYDKARAITDYFANPDNGFSYSLATAGSDSGDALVDFLKNKTGYCQQYAAAMAVMLRLSGVPARVVLGYAHSTPDAGGQFTITSYDAHAWVEAYFDGLGWIPFDPTPLAGISGGPANDLTWAPHNSQAPRHSTGPTTAPSVHTLPSRTASRPVEQQTAPVVHATPTDYSGLLVALLIVLAVIAVLLIPAAVRWRRRRARLHRVRAGDAEALWAELSDTATDLGYVWSPSRTPRQVAAWLGGTADVDPHGALRTITSAVERARYAPAGTARPDGVALVKSLDEVTDGLRARRSTPERARARFWPASLGWSRALPGSRWLRRLSRRH